MHLASFDGALIDLSEAQREPAGSRASPFAVLDSVSSDLMTWNSRRSFQNLDKWLSELRENTDPSDAWLQLDSSNS